MINRPSGSNQIFISYHRADSADITGRIYDRLTHKFGRDTVFKDVDSIPLGVNFRSHLDSVISECAVMLAVVGNTWTREVADPRDFVRIELELALKRELPVIPLLVQGSAMPMEEELPESIAELAYRNGQVIGKDPYFHHDVDRLIKSLEAMLENSRGAVSNEPPPGRADAAVPESPRPGDADGVQQPRERVMLPVYGEPDRADTPDLSQPPSPEPARRPGPRWYLYSLAVLAGFITSFAVRAVVIWASEETITEAARRGIPFPIEVHIVALVCEALAVGVVGLSFGAAWPRLKWKWGLWLNVLNLLILPVNLLIQVSLSPGGLLRILLTIAVAAAQVVSGCVGSYAGSRISPRR